MKERAKEDFHNTSLASDYGEWAHRAWRIIRDENLSPDERDAAFLYTMHWLEGDGNESEEDIQAMRVWWRAILPALKDGIQTGTEEDISSIMFQLRDGQYNHVLIPEELLDLISLLCDRVELGVVQGCIDIQATTNNRGGHHTWREGAKQAAGSLDSLRQQNLLTTDILRERTYRLLERLSGGSIGILEASTHLQHLQDVM